ncbi:hypothetical protein [Lentzea sp. NPDC055074]
MSISSRIATTLATAAGIALVTASPVLADELVDVEVDGPLVVVEGPLTELD